MAKDDITMRYKLDISDLKKGITEANNQIKLANAQFKAASAGMDNWSKSSDGIKAKLTQLSSVLDAQKSKLENYKQQQKALNDAYTENGKRANELKTKLQQLADQGVKKTSDEYKKYEKALTDVEKEQIANKKASDDLQVTILNQQGTVNKTEKEFADLKGTLTKVEQAEKTAAQSGRDVDDVLKEMDDSARNTSGGFTVMKGALANLVADGIRMAINAVKDFARETIEVGKQFDASMSQVQAVSGASGKELEALRDKAKEMGANTKFSASEAADAFNYMAMAGWKTSDMLSGIEGILNLAAASNTDLANTSDIVTDALTAMGYQAGDAGRLADVMAAASSNANTNVQMMGATFQYAAPIVGALGYNMEDTAVAIGLMANAGIKGEKAGTALRSILTRLASPPAEAAKAMDQLGISVTNADGTMKPFSEVMEILRQKFDGLSESEQAQMAKSIAGQEAMSGLLSIVNAAPADFDKLTQAVANSNGAAAQMAATMQDNLQGDLTELGSKLEGVQISMYEKFEPAMRKGVEVLSKMLDGLNFVIEHSTAFITTITSVGAAVGTFLTIMNWSSIMGAATTALNGVKAAMLALNATLLANPIALVVAAIAGLVVAFVTLWNKSEAFRNFWIGLWDSIKAAVQPVIDFIVKTFTTAWERIKVVWEPVQEFFTNLFNGIKEGLQPVLDSMTKAFEEAWELIKTIWNVVKPFFKGIWEGIKATFSVVATVLGEFFKAAWTAIKVVWDVVKPYFELLWNNIKAIFSVVKDVLFNFFNLAWIAIKAVWDTVVGYFKAVWDSIALIFSVVKSVLTGDFQGAWDGIKKIVNTWKGYFSGVWNNIKSIFSGVASFFKNSFQSAWNGIKAVFGNFGSFFSGLWNTIKNTFSNLGTSIGDAISGAVKAGINGVISQIEKTINKAINLINGAIKMINKLPGVSVSTISTLNLPRLEKGGILKKGQVGLLEGNGAEAVVPLDKNKLWIKAVADQMKKEIASSDISAANNPTVAKDNVNNFTQNIYANKPLSRIEIYRQTKNLIALRGGI